MPTFARLSAPPTPADPTPQSQNGAQLFEKVGCSLCHSTTPDYGDVAVYRHVRASIIIRILTLHCTTWDGDLRTASRKVGPVPINSGRRRCGVWGKDFSSCTTDARPTCCERFALMMVEGRKPAESSTNSIA